MVLAEAQNTTGYRMAPNKETTQVDFLANYYSQDGDFGAPQGGLGTEELTNIAGLVVVTVPLDSNSAIGVAAGVDYYSSASTDQIDRQLSTASAQDVRSYGTVTYTERRLAEGRTYSATVGTSQEYDYSSFSGGVAFTQEWDRGAQELSFQAQAFVDRWLLIYPLEFRRINGFADTRGPLPTADRRELRPERQLLPHRQRPRSAIAHRGSRLHARAAEYALPPRLLRR